MSSLMRKEQSSERLKLPIPICIAHENHSVQCSLMKSVLDDTDTVIQYLQVNTLTKSYIYLALMLLTV